MNLAILHSRASSGMSAPLVTVETHISNGIPKFNIVGLPEAAVKESKDRVRSAILNSHFEFPARRITVNLAPADLPKDGGRFDLPIALGVLAATGQIDRDKLSEYEFAGELALSGELRQINGALPFAIGTCRTQKKLIIPAENAKEVALIDKVECYPANHLLEVCAHLAGTQPIRPFEMPISPESKADYKDLADVRGQFYAKRALEIAAAGGHSLLMFGPPGTGKSMLASRLPGILPNMTDDEAIESAAIISLAKGRILPNEWRKRCFRSPHHTASGVALVGGGCPPKPGEISLSHHGVLFLDELPEFDRRVLEALREPLENGTITISRAAHQAEFPAKFQLISAMNPCPCGYLGDQNGRCRCSPEQIQRYRNKISGPLLDRIDMHVEVARLPEHLLTNKQDPKVESSEKVRERVNKARDIQLQRAQCINSQLVGKDLETVCDLNEEDRDFLTKAIKKLRLSARSYHRILRVSRTIADLDQSEKIENSHLSEALNYRSFDRNVETFF